MVHDGRRELVDELVHAARVLGSAGCLPATDGNFSARVNGDLILITLRGVEKRELTVSDFTEVRIGDAAPANGSTEWPMHRALYSERPEVQCVLHVHSPGLTAFAVAHRTPRTELLAEAVTTVGKIALVPFVEPGSADVGEALLATDPTAGVYLLANHGAVAVGASVRDALHRLERAEFLARVELDAATLGGGKPLAADQVASLI